MLVLIAGVLEVPWPFDRRFRPIKNMLADVSASMSRPINERSAFFIVDDFSAGVGKWLNNRSLDITDAGYLAVTEGLSLHRETLNLKSYRLDFEAKIVSEAVGWVVRASNADSYYAFKLVKRERNSQSLDFVRYAVVGGVKDALLGAASVAVPENVTGTADFNRISVRVRNNQITTLVNGWGVDFWQDDRFDRGGVGLLADRGESALVRQFSITGNDDPWGLILYGMRETITSVQDALSAPPALQVMPKVAAVSVPTFDFLTLRPLLLNTNN